MNTVTDKELDAFYGVDKPHTGVRQEMVDVLVNQVRKVDYRYLAVPYVTYSLRPNGQIKPYSVEDVYSDYMGNATAALMEVIAKSECPFVQELRKKIAEAYVNAHADDVEEFRA